MSRKQRSASAAQAQATNLNVALAVARQRLGDAHFRFVLELIRRGQGEVAAPQLLVIYARLHYLSEIDLQALRNRVLVYLGQVSNTDVTQLPNTFVAIDGAVEWDITASLVERIRKRLSGRRNYAFREWVELHGGHVESKLLRIHVENLLGLCESADPQTGPAELARTYVRELALREGLYEPLYHGLLERLYEMPVEEEDMVDESAADDEAAPASPAASHEGRRAS